MAAKQAHFGTSETPQAKQHEKKRPSQDILDKQVLPKMSIEAIRCF